MPVFAYGNFITVAINFVILAFIIFLMVQQINRLKRTEPPRRRRRAPEDVVAAARDPRLAEALSRSAAAAAGVAAATQRRRAARCLGLILTAVRASGRHAGAFGVHRVGNELRPNLDPTPRSGRRHRINRTAAHHRRAHAAKRSARPPAPRPAVAERDPLARRAVRAASATAGDFKQRFAEALREKVAAELAPRSGRTRNSTGPTGRR